MNAQGFLKGYSDDGIGNEIRTPKQELTASSDTNVNEIETVRIHRAGGARGATIAKTSYFAMADAILSLLLIKGEVSLVELVNHIDEVDTNFKVDTKWLLLQVKQDLEHRGFIKSYLKNKLPFINLIRKLFLKSEFRNVLIQQVDRKLSTNYLF